MGSERRPRAFASHSKKDKSQRPQRLEAAGEHGSDFSSVLNSFGGGCDLGDEDRHTALEPMFVSKLPPALLLVFSLTACDPGSEESATTETGDTSEDSVGTTGDTSTGDTSTGDTTENETVDTDDSTAGDTTGNTTGNTTGDTTGDTDDDTTTDDTSGAQPCAPDLELYDDANCEQLADGVVAFTPQHKLWSDGLDKHRFIYLPPGETIDVSNPNAWEFPVGTVLWKHFDTPEGQRIETRRLTKHGVGVGADNWTFETFLWNEAGDDVTALEDGLENALGTDHDIPSTEDCQECHNGGQTGMMMPNPNELIDIPLGFSAIQLNHEASETTLASLLADGWLNGSIELADANIPGDAIAEAALGYLHANCGHCHGGPNPPKNLTLWIDIGAATVENTTTYQDTVDQPTQPVMPNMGLDELPPWRILPGDPQNSAIPWRMEKRTNDAAPMPPLGTEIVDDEGLSLVETWINDLGA